VRIDVTDALAYQSYVAANAKAFAKYGGFFWFAVDPSV
jgi:uncharacterized protein (DUF1330 family)